MNQQRHIVFERTIDGIIDLIVVHPFDAWQSALDSIRDYYLHQPETNRRLNLYCCDCNNANSHKDQVGHKV